MIALYVCVYLIDCVDGIESYHLTKVVVVEGEGAVVLVPVLVPVQWIECLLGYCYCVHVMYYESFHCMSYDVHLDVAVDVV